MSKRPESLKKDKLEHQKKDISSQEDESKEKFASNLKKPEKRKDLKEGIEVKDDGVYFDLNVKKKICVKKFKSNILIDIREYFKKDDEMLPTKKGVALTVDSWKKLKDYIEEIDEAIENA